MFFPIRSERQLKRTPYVTWTLIGINVLVFAATLGSIEAADLALREASMGLSSASLDQIKDAYPAIKFYLWPNDTQIYQYITYQFLHAGWMHLIGNMIFLYVFGIAVEDRIGRFAYLFFYLAGGVVAGLGHVLFESQPVLGASGSVAGVTGMFLALFPLVHITIAYWWIFIGTFEVSGMVLIGFRIAVDIFLQTTGSGGVAYLAHLSGYGYGFAVGMFLLAIRLLPREPYDMLALIERRRRRNKFRKLTQQGYQPWMRDSGAGQDVAEAPSEEEQAIMNRRAEISQLLTKHDLLQACTRYRELLNDYPGQRMPEQQQLDLANHFMADGQYDTAATAYELFLAGYKVSPQRHHVRLLLGLIYARYLHQPERAKNLLTEALPFLKDGDHTLAEQVLKEIPSA